MESQKALIELIREQAKIEKESVEKLAETEKKIGTRAGRLLILEMEWDSQKHAAILEAVLDALDSAQPSKSLWEQAFSEFADPIIVKREIEDHRALSGSMAAHIQKEISKTDDETVRMVLLHLAEDERRHNEILDTIAHRAYKMIR